MDEQKVKAAWWGIRFIAWCFEKFSTGGQQETARKVNDALDEIEDIGTTGEKERPE